MLAIIPLDGDGQNDPADIPKMLEVLDQGYDVVSGWRMIEVGPRIGGYRPELYSLTIELNHIANDVVNRMGIAPEIPTKVLRHAAVLQTYAHEEGRLKSIHGLNKIEQLSSFVSMKQRFQEGEMLYFAQNNGHPAFEVMLCHEDEAQLRADLQTIEQVLQIELMAEHTVKVHAHAV